MSTGGGVQAAALIGPVLKGLLLEHVVAGTPAKGVAPFDIAAMHLAKEGYAAAAGLMDDVYVGDPAERNEQREQIVRAYRSGRGSDAYARLHRPCPEHVRDLQEPRIRIDAGNAPHPPPPPWSGFTRSLMI